MEALRSQDVTAVLDVRRLAEYEVASVPEAFNIAHTRLLVRKEELPQDKVWLVHCRTGTRAAAASALWVRGAELMTATAVNQPGDPEPQLQVRTWLEAHETLAAESLPAALVESG